MTLRIATLCDNTAERGGFLGEWGLSILVETEDAKILLDTGNGSSLIHNAGLLDIDLGKIDKIVLSHGHFDHTGGLRDLLRRMNKNIQVIAHPDIWQAKFARRQGEKERYIGIPYQREELERLGADFLLSSRPVNVAENVMTTGEVPMNTGFEEIDAGLYVKEGLTWKPDAIMDDQALIVKTTRGLVIILGCAHRGIINTLYHAQQITGETDIHMVLGGSHLMNASKERLRKTIDALRKLNVQKMGLCHCTEMYAISVLAQEFNEKFFFNKAGTIVNIS
ncbi:MAG: MBL fold metallo-hydrolase [Desulfobacterales bacterium]